MQTIGPSTTPDFAVRPSAGHAPAARFFGSELDISFLTEEAIPAIFTGKKAGDDVRIWVMDCGRGEVAYSLAMLLCEENRRRKSNLPINVFATDGDPEVLTIARGGRYEPAVEREMSSDRLKQWFVSADQAHTVSKELRATCTFSLHDLIRDVPFSHMDLIYCGGALRRLPMHVQDQAVPLLHFALRNGYLLPFADDCLERHPTLFAPARGANGVYRQLDGERRLFPPFPLTRRAGRRKDHGGHWPREAQVHRLRAELLSTKEHLRQTVDQLRAANRKLQFSNEEYQSLNEELRSTNEELQASKAELQSVNTELEAVNEELSSRIEELGKANSNLKGFFDSTRAKTIFVDRQLRITKFAPAITDIFPVIFSDIGRAITDVACELAYDVLPEDVALVIHTATPVEREVRNPRTGAHYLVRVLPYSGANDVVVGAVLTFLDISAIVQAERAQRQSEARFSAMAGNVPAVLFTADADMSWDYVNPRFQEFTGLPRESALAAGWLAAVHPDDRDQLKRHWEQTRSSGVFEHVFRLRDVSRGYRWYFLRATAGPAGAGAARWTGSLLDTHDRHIAESRQRLLFVTLQRRVKAILGMVRSIAGHTKAGSASADEFFDRFDSRLEALGRMQASIARYVDSKVDLEALLWDEILAHVTGCEDRVALSGPAILVDERVGQALGLAIHELTTNALKYGALALASGGIEVRWSLSNEPREPHLRLEWRESAVPIVDTNPKRVGFGREYLERRLPIELDARAWLRFQPGGAHFVIDVPLYGATPAGGES